MNEREPAPALLADGTPPKSPAELLAYLTEIGIEHATVRHPPVFTVAEAKALRGELPGGHIKNLFLRNKKGRMWLLTCEEDRELRLDALAEALGAKRFSFASPERLGRYLGVAPGAVTPFAAINDRGGEVSVVLDAALLAHELVNVHPLDNAMTTAIAARDLVKFLDSVGHPPTVIDLNAFCA